MMLLTIDIYNVMVVVIPYSNNIVVDHVVKCVMLSLLLQT